MAASGRGDLVGPANRVSATLPSFGRRAAIFLGSTVLVASGMVVATVSIASTASAANPTLTSIEAPVPANADPGPGVALQQSVCTDANDCVAVGGYYDNKGHEQILIETYTSGVWTPTEGSLPSNANPDANPDATLNAISCPATGTCEAVGSYNNANGDAVLFADSLASGVWKPTILSLPSNSTASTYPNLNGISCPVSGSCVAVGEYASTDGSLDQPPLVETLSGGTWTPSSTGLPTGGAASDLQDVDCTAVGSCVAVGFYGVPESFDGLDNTDTLPLVDTLSSGAWTPSEAAIPSNANTNPADAEDVALNGVSCEQTGICEATGVYETGQGNQLALAEDLTDGIWGVQPLSLPTGADTGASAAYLELVACLPGQRCIAAGGYDNTNGDPVGLVETLSGGVWTPSVVQLPANSNIDPTAYPFSASCLPSDACLVMGWYVDSNQYDQGFIDTVPTPGPVTTYADPSIDSPLGITTGSDGALWFTNEFAGSPGVGSIGRVTTSGVVTNYTDSFLDRPQAITSGPDGVLWFATQFGGSNDTGLIGSITTAGAFTKYTDPTIDNPDSIVSGPDGALWFTNQGGNSIGRITTAGVVTNYTGTGISSPDGIAVGTDGALWFTNEGNNSIGRITTAGVVTNYTGTGIDSPQSIASGSDGALWFTNGGNNSIGRITTADVVTNYTGTGISTPDAITSGPDNALWFANRENNSIGRITTAGVVTNYTNSTISLPAGITSGPDGAVWFSNSGTPSIGRITTPMSITTTTVPSSVPVNTAYPTTTLAAAGGTAPYTWTVTSGALPAGLTLSTAGVISGTAASAETSTFTVEAADDSYPGESATQSYTITVTPGPSGPYSSLPPVRVCDTRPNNPSHLTGPSAQCNGASNTGSTIAAGESLNVNLAGSFGIPADATAVVLNVTVVNPAAPGYVTAYPTGSAAPFASNINYVASQVVPNLIEVGIGTGGDVSFFTSAKSDIVVDAEGFVTPTSLGGGGLYAPLASPARLCDTRAGNPSDLVGPDAQCNGLDNLGETLKAGSSIQVQVGGDNAIPSTATAAVLNVTVANPKAAGYLTVYPQGGTQPFASNVNYTAGQVTANRVIVPLSAAGMVTVYSSAQADVIVDVSGYYTAAGGGAGSEFTSEGAPVRICDTRPNNPSKLLGAYNQCDDLTIGANQTRTINVAGLAGVPSNGATAVVINLTGIAPTAPTYLTVYPGPTRPFASDLNPAVGTVGANLVVATLSSTGTVSIYNSAGSVNVVVDVLGWYEPVA
jgi:streptogramin lyase